MYLEADLIFSFNKEISKVIGDFVQVFNLVACLTAEKAHYSKLTHLFITETSNNQNNRSHTLWNRND